MIWGWFARACSFFSPTLCFKEADSKQVIMWVPLIVIINLAPIFLDYYIFILFVSFVLLFDIRFSSPHVFTFSIVKEGKKLITFAFIVINNLLSLLALSLIKESNICTFVTHTIEKLFYVYNNKSDFSRSN